MVCFCTTGCVIFDRVYLVLLDVSCSVPSDKVREGISIRIPSTQIYSFHHQIHTIQQLHISHPKQQNQTTVNNHNTTQKWLHHHHQATTTRTRAKQTKSPSVSAVNAPTCSTPVKTKNSAPSNSHAAPAPTPKTQPLPASTETYSTTMLERRLASRRMLEVILRFVCPLVSVACFAVIPCDDSFGRKRSGEGGGFEGNGGREEGMGCWKLTVHFVLVLANFVCCWIASEIE